MGLAATIFALGALQAAEESDLQAKRNQQVGCRQFFPKKGPTGPTGPQGPQGNQGTPGTIINPAYAGSTSHNQNFSNTTETPFIFTDLYTPNNIGHTDVTSNYTIHVSGVYLINWTVVVTPQFISQTLGTVDVFSIKLNAGAAFSIPYSNVPAAGFGAASGLPPLNNLMSGSVSLPLSAGDVVNLTGQSTFATPASPTIANADLCITKISLP